MKLGFAGHGRPTAHSQENLELVQKALGQFEDPQQVEQQLTLVQWAQQQALNKANQEFIMAYN